MATYSADAITTAGVVPATRTAASGDKVTPDDNLILRVTNGSGGSINVLLPIPGTTFAGEPQPDKTIAVAASATKAIRLLREYADPSDGLIAVNWSATTSVTFTVERV